MNVRETGWVNRGGERYRAGVERKKRERGKEAQDVEN